MTRVITVTDDEIDTSARIEIVRSDDGHVVRRIVVESESDSGLPDEVVSALIPYIGLPAVRSTPNGRSHMQEPEQRAHSVPAAAFVAAPDETDDDAAGAVPTQRKPEIESAPPPSEPPPPPRVPSPRDVAAKKRPGPRTTYTKPTDEDLASVIGQVGPRPKILAEHYQVPVTTVNNWLYAWRKRKNAAAASQS